MIPHLYHRRTLKTFALSSPKLRKIVETGVRNLIEMKPA